MRQLGKKQKLWLPLMVMLAFVVVPLSVSADPSVPLSECRDQTLDQSGFNECLILLWQQSDSALDEIEQNWLQTLVVDEQSQANPGVVQPELKSADKIDDKNPDTPTGPNSRVIAIVSGEAFENLPVPANARVINLDESESATEVGDSNSVNTIPSAVLFETMPALFREYRDQRCLWEAGLKANNGATSYQLACKVALNRQQSLQLRRLLAEKKASDIGGESYRGYYLRTLSGGNFQSCDRRQDWWVTGTDEVLQTLERRYDDVASENLEIVYMELRGRMQPSEISGPGADFVATLNVAAVNLMRPILEQDCQPGVVSDAQNNAELNDIDALPEDNLSDIEDGVIEIAGPPAVTVDDLGDAGFLYGYFSNWNSACAVDQLSVCRATTEVEYSSEGEWQMVVDRSSKNNWQVRLIPTTENHIIEGKIHWSVDTTDKIGVAASDSIIETNRGLVLASGQRAKSVVNRFRAGQSVDFEWLKPDQSSATLTFSLVGITRALQYFDQAEK